MNQENELIAKLNSEKQVYDIAYIDTVPIKKITEVTTKDKSH